MKAKVVKTTSIDIAHFLTEYVGVESTLHGHTWGLVFEFELEQSIHPRDIERLTNRVLSDFEHRVLNQLAEFAHIDPTPLNFILVLFEKIRDQCDPEIVKLAGISVREGSFTWRVENI